MSWTKPTASEFKAFFVRDFNYAAANEQTSLEKIIDADITRAIDEAEICFNDSLFGTEAQTTLVFMYLAAFYLVYNLQNSARGVAAQVNFPVNSTTVGGVNISYTVPERFLKDAFISSLTQNGYGMKYLSMVLPMVVGNVGNLAGGTTWD